MKFSLISFWVKFPRWLLMPTVCSYDKVCAVYMEHAQYGNSFCPRGCFIHWWPLLLAVLYMYKTSSREARKHLVIYRAKRVWERQQATWLYLYICVFAIRESQRNPSATLRSDFSHSENSVPLSFVDPPRAHSNQRKLYI